MRPHRASGLDNGTVEAYAVCMSEMEVATPDTRPLKPRQSADRPYHVGDPIPNALSAGELMRVLNLNEGAFYVYQKDGKFKRFEFKRPVSYSKRYSGALVKRYLDQAGDL